MTRGFGAPQPDAGAAGAVLEEKSAGSQTTSRKKPPADLRGFPVKKA